MISRRNTPAEAQPNDNTEAADDPIPLQTYVENLQRTIHQHPSDEVVASIIAENFSPHLLVDTDTTHLDFNAFRRFNTSFREKFVALRIVDRKPVVFRSDKYERAGVVGFATSWLFEGKEDGGLFDGDTIEIFEVSWIRDRKRPLGGHRLVTKAFAVIGDMHPIFEPTLPETKQKRLARTTKVASGRISKTSRHSSRSERRYSLRSGYMAT